MLRNNADARRCSNFELGLPVLSPVYKLTIGKISLCVRECQCRQTDSSGRNAGRYKPA